MDYYAAWRACDTRSRVKVAEVRRNEGVAKQRVEGKPLHLVVVHLHER